MPTIASCLLTIFLFLEVVYRKLPLTDANLIWFTDGSYLKTGQGYYQVGYAITSRADITKGFYLPERDLAHMPD